MHETYQYPILRKNGVDHNQFFLARKLKFRYKKELQAPICFLGSGGVLFIKAHGAIHATSKISNPDD